MTVLIPYSPDEKPGTWTELLTVDKFRSANINCPKCNRVATLIRCSIDSEGIVTPSIICPNLDCSFHEMVKLEGWAEAINGTIKVEEVTNDLQS